MKVRFAEFSLNNSQLNFLWNVESFPSIMTVTKRYNVEISTEDVFLQTDDSGRVGNVLCAYSSLMVKFLSD